MEGSRGPAAGRRTHLVKQLYPSAHTEMLSALICSLVWKYLICVGLLCPNPRPHSTLLSGYSHSNHSLLILLNQSINVGQIALMCSESLANGCGDYNNYSTRGRDEVEDREGERPEEWGK